MTFQPLGRVPWAVLLVSVGLIAFVSAQLPPIIALDRAIQDRLIRASPAAPPAAGPVLVDIDERSLQMLGPWPWPRALIAELSQRLTQAGVTHQAWDLFFSEPYRDDPVWKGQMERVGTSLTLGQILVLDPDVASPPRVGARVAWGGLEASPAICAREVQVFGHLGLAPTLAGNRQVGHLSATPDQDGRLRSLPAVVCDSGAAYPQFALAVALALSPGQRLEVQAGSIVWGPSAWLSVGEYRFPVDRRGWVAIPYWRPHSQWESVSASEVLSGRAPEGLLRDRVVLVGSTAVGLGDTVSTPHHPSAPGMSAHAELLGGAFSGQWRFEPVGAVWVSTALAITLSLLAVAVANRPRRGMAIAVFLSITLAAPFAAALLAVWFGRLIPVLPPVLALAVGSGFFVLAQLDQQRRQTRRLAQHLESFLPKSLAREVAQQSPDGQALGRPGEGVLLGVQVRGLDRWTGAVDSLRALAFIHGLLTALDRALVHSQGRLEQRQGELVLIILPQTANLPSVVSQIRSDLEPLLLANETAICPLALQLAAESGPYLLAIAGGQASRRPLLLGPVVDSVQAMVALGQELAAPVIIGPVLALHWRVSNWGPLIEMGHFVLPEQPEAKPLFRWQAEPRGG